MFKGMTQENKWKYLIHFQSEEFTELISKDIIAALYERKVKAILPDYLEEIEDVNEIQNMEIDLKDYDPTGWNDLNE